MEHLAAVIFRVSLILIMQETYQGMIKTSIVSRSSKYLQIYQISE